MRAWPPRLPTLQRPRPAAASLPHSLLLAALLHLWLVLVLGNAPGGTAEPGQGVWGSINIRLRGPVSEQAPTAPQPQIQPGGAPGQAAGERWGGAVRARATAAEPEPGADRLGHWGPQPFPAARAADLDPPQALARPEVPSVPALARVGPADARLRAVPTAAGARGEPIPAVATLPSNAPLAAVPAPAAVPPAPAPERQLASPLNRPVAAAGPAVPALAPSPPATLPSLAEPTPLTQAAPLRALRAAPPAPTSVAEPVSALTHKVTEAAAAPLPEIATPWQEVAATQAPAGSAAAGQAVEAATRTLPAAAPAPATSLDAGARVGHDVATPASNAASVLPRLNLELARPRGGELSRGSARGVLPVLPRPPEQDDKLARDIEKAAKLDCRKAYAGAGLLAVVPLAADALGKSGGCKW